MKLWTTDAQRFFPQYEGYINCHSKKKFKISWFQVFFLPDNFRCSLLVLHRLVKSAYWVLPLTIQWQSLCFALCMTKWFGWKISNFSIQHHIIPLEGGSLTLTTLSTSCVLLCHRPHSPGGTFFPYCVPKGLICYRNYLWGNLSDHIS